MSNGSWPRKLAARYKAAGWDISISRSGHYKAKDSRGRVLTFPTTPSDRRAEMNALGDARRYGLEDAEQEMRLRAERDRLQRIADDRASVTLPKTENEEGHEVKKEVATAEGSLGYALVIPKDGKITDELVQVAIAEIAPAMHSTPVTRGKSVPLKDGEELLLADGRVIYRCAKPAASIMNPTAKGICHRTFFTVPSLKSHITYHSRTTMPTPPRQRRKAERDAEYAEALRLAEHAAVDVIAEQTAQALQAPESSFQSAGIVARISRLSTRFAELKDHMDELTANLGETIDQLEQLIRELPDHVASDEMLDKVAKYDELRKHFG